MQDESTFARELRRLAQQDAYVIGLEGNLKRLARTLDATLEAAVVGLDTLRTVRAASRTAQGEGAAGVAVPRPGQVLGGLASLTVTGIDPVDEVAWRKRARRLERALTRIARAEWERKRQERTEALLRRMPRMKYVTDVAYAVNDAVRDVFPHRGTSGIYRMVETNTLRRLTVLSEDDAGERLELPPTLHLGRREHDALVDDVAAGLRSLAVRLAPDRATASVNEAGSLVDLDDDTTRERFGSLVVRLEEMADYVLDGAAALPPVGLLAIPIVAEADVVGLLVVTVEDVVAEAADLAHAYALVSLLAPHLSIARRIHLEGQTLVEAIDTSVRLAPGYGNMAPAMLVVLADRIRRILHCDWVSVIPYDMGTGALDGGAAVTRCTMRAQSAGKAPPMPAATVDELSTDDVWTWERRAGPATRFSAQHSLDRVYFRHIETEGEEPGDRARLGLLVVGWVEGGQAAVRGGDPALQARASDDEWLQSYSKVLAEILRAHGRVEKDAIAVDTERRMKDDLLNRLVLGWDPHTLDDVTARLAMTAARGAVRLVDGSGALVIVPSAIDADVGTVIAATGATAYGPRAAVPLPGHRDGTFHVVDAPGSMAKDGVSTDVVVPIVSTTTTTGGHLRGHLVVHRRSARALEPTQVAHITSLRDELEMCLRLTDLNGQMHGLRRTAEINDLRDPAEIVRRTVDEIQQLTGAERVVGRRFSIDRTTLEPVAVAGALDDPPAAIPLGAGVTGLSGSQARRVHHADVTDPATLTPLGFRARPVEGERTTGSVLAVPIAYRNQALGVVTIEHAQPWALSPYLDYVSIVGYQAGYAWHLHAKADEVEDARQASEVNGMLYASTSLAHDHRRALQTISLRLRALADGPDVDRDGLHLLAQEVGDKAEETTVPLAFGDPAESYRREPLDLGEEVRSVIEGMDADLARARDQGRTVRADVPFGIGVESVAAALRFAVGTVVSNSVDALDRAGRATGTIDICARVSPDDPTRVLLTVTDDGPGVAPDRLASLGREPADSAHGAGVALFLASSWLALADTEMRFGAAPGGGLEVTLDLRAHTPTTTEVTPP